MVFVLASQLRNVKVKNFFIEILALGARRTLSLGVEMKYFFWTSVCFLVMWGALNLPGLLKKCGLKASGNKIQFLKILLCHRSPLLLSLEPPSFLSILRQSPSRAGPRLAPSSSPPSAIRPQRHEKAFPPWTHSLWEFVRILEMSLAACLNPDESILQILVSTNSLFCDF